MLKHSVNGWEACILYFLLKYIRNSEWTETLHFLGNYYIQTDLQ